MSKSNSTSLQRELQRESQPVGAGNGTAVGFTLVRSRRKTIVVRVTHEQVEVRAPLFVSNQQVRQFVDRNHEWITAKLEHKASQEAEKLVVDQGRTIFYQARPLTIELCEAGRDQVAVDERVFRIIGRRVNSRAADILQTWLMTQAKSYLPQRTRDVAARMKVSHKLKEVVFRKTRTKWGHCTSGGRIQYNWLIMMAPNAIIDYMISHEVCHLVHMNHSREYWRLVQTLCPQYRYYVKWLKRHEHRLWF